MKKFKIEMTEDEMIRFYANKIVEDGIKNCYEFSNIIDINDYGEDIAKFKNVILERIYRDERVTDVNLDKDGNFDMVFYTDFCPYYYDMDMILDNNYLIDSFSEIDMLKDFGDYYIEKCLFDNPYISIRNLINQFVEEQTDNQEKRKLMSNIIKMKVNESDFIRDNMDGIEVYITPHNYKELKQAIEETIQNTEEEELV
ncbi:MAG: hypothetical protein ACI4VP_01445 [Clostridia bacterium]